MLPNGEATPVEQLKAGSIVLTANGHEMEIDSIYSQTEKSHTLKQRTKHYIHLLESPRPLPWGLVEDNCFERSVLALCTYNRIMTSHNTKANIKMFRYCRLDDHLTEDGRVVKMIKFTEVPLPGETLMSKLRELADEQRKLYDNNFINWTCEVGDLKYLPKEIRASTRLLLHPISFEHPTLRPWTERKFKRKISDEELEAMAWMLGFWIGDGFRGGAMFALNSEDHDVNGRLEENAKLWGMTYVKKHYRKDTFSAMACLYTPKQGGGHHLNVNNPFIEGLKGLRFYGDGKIKGPKNVPHFMRMDQILVRKAFMAGLIDSDGFSCMEDNVLSVYIPTVYPPIRDGITFICRSLGLNLTTSFYPAHVSSEGYNCADIWCFSIYGGSNPEMLLSILRLCSHTRKREPPVFFYKKHASEAGENEDSDDGSSEENIHEHTRSMRIDSHHLLHLCGESETFFPNNSDMDFSTINPSRQFFKSISEKRGCNIYGIKLHADMKVLLDSQIVFEKSRIELGKQICDKKYERKRFSCGEAEEETEWRVAPWRNNVKDRLCRVCYDTYSRSQTRCSNTSCNRVFCKNQLGKKAFKSQPKLKLNTERIPICDSCGSPVTSEAKASLSKKSTPKSDVCHTCGPKSDARWHKLPFDNTKVWCNACYKRYANTRVFCHKCHKIPSTSEFEAMKLEPGTSSLYPCLKCSTLIKPDDSRPALKRKKLECRTETCHSCGPVSCKQWCSLPWDMNGPGLICVNCSYVYRQHGVRCLNDKCGKIFRRAELNELVEKRTILPGGAVKVCRLCFVCQGETAWKHTSYPNSEHPFANHPYVALLIRIRVAYNTIVSKIFT